MVFTNRIKHDTGNCEKNHLKETMYPSRPSVPQPRGDSASGEQVQDVVEAKVLVLGDTGVGKTCLVFRYFPSFLFYHDYIWNRFIFGEQGLVYFQNPDLDLRKYLAVLLKEDSNHTELVRLAQASWLRR